jgi:endonuclease YncB( thermonuclease family)
MPKIINFRKRPPPRHQFIRLASVSASAVCVVGVTLLALFAHKDSKPIPLQSRPETLIGQASVIDGDTIEIHDSRIRLYGIDVPESDQTCLINGVPWRCGQKAALALADKIRNQAVRCEPKDRDVYGRTVAVCWAGETDLNAWMTAQGWAWAYRQYSLVYVTEEQQASKAKLGVWQGDFIYAWDWRHDSKRTDRSPANADSGQCNIKGNINQRGEHIYHVPSGAYYDRTFINPLRGERWFCSEQEAVQAGWRRSKR